jgi:putative ATPase
VLERLTDDNIRDILISAVERVCIPSTEDPSPVDLSSEPSMSQTLATPLSSQTLVPSQELAPGKLKFPAFPQLTPRILSSVIALSTGDARTALSLLELIMKSPKDIKEASLLSSLRRSVSASYDHSGESHYDMISALHKSIRGSQGSAAMYWLARMLAAGEDPVYIARRMVVCASEDIGLADRHALPLVICILLKS